MARVAGCSRVPEPPARMMPLRSVMVKQFSLLRLKATLNTLLRSD